MKNFFLNIKRKKTGKKSPFSFIFSFGKDPYLDWKALVLFFVVFFVIDIIFSIYFFSGVSSGDLFKVSNDQVKPKTFDRVFTKEVLSDFDSKQKRLEELNRNKADIINP